MAPRFLRLTLGFFRLTLALLIMPCLALGFASTFKNPLLPSGADPWVTSRDG